MLHILLRLSIDEFSIAHGIDPAIQRVAAHLAAGSVAVTVVENAEHKLARLRQEVGDL